MAKAIKQNGKYQLEPDPALTARSRAREDQEKVKAKLNDEELRELLQHILTRLKTLEKG